MIREKFTELFSEVAASKAQIDKIVKQLVDAKSAYYGAGKSKLSDAQFDALEDNLRKLDPKNAYFKMVGAKPTKRSTVLPVPMGSLSKVRSENGGLAALLGSVNKKLFTASDKMDGLASLYYLDAKTKQIKLLTRGDGTKGSDVSMLIPYIRKVGKKPRAGMYIVGELIIDNKTFGNINKDVEFKNPRNLMAGIANRGHTNSVGGGKVVSFLVHGMYKGKTSIPLAKCGPALKSAGWEVVPFKIFRNPTPDQLQKYMEKRKSVSKYLIDGIVLEHDDWKLAYKGGEEQAVGIVKEIQWQTSRHGLLKPVVVFDPPIRLAGVDISRASGHNAKYIVENKIGKGSQVTLIRSGEVIPYITGVIKATRANLPAKSVGWEWDKTNTNIKLTAEKLADDEDVKVTRLSHFIATLGIKGVQYNSAWALVEAGITNFTKLWTAPKSRLIGILGNAKGETLFSGLEEKKRTVDTSTMIYATNLLGDGYGTRRLNALFAVIPYQKAVALAREGKLEAAMKKIHGFGDVLGGSTSKGLVKFDSVMKKLGWQPKLTRKIRVTNSKFSGWNFYMTGFRDEEMKAKIIAGGGTEVNGTSSKLTHLIVKDKSVNNSKTVNAKEKGIKVITRQDVEKLL